MLVTVRRTCRQYGALLTCIASNLALNITIEKDGQADKLGREKPNLPEAAPKQYESLTDGPANNYITSSYLHLIQEDQSIQFKIKEEFQQADSPIGEADVTY